MPVMASRKIAVRRRVPAPPSQAPESEGCGAGATGGTSGADDETAVRLLCESVYQWRRLVGLLLLLVVGRTGLILLGEDSYPLILLAYDEIEDVAVHRQLYDPLAEQEVWKTRFEIPRESRLTHDGVGEEVLDESYRPTMAFHAGPGGDLGRYVVVAAVQIYSPSFLLFVDKNTGQVEGWYANPSHFDAGIVIDLDGDGRQELVFGAADNAMDRAAVTALRPGAWSGSAATVKWNETGRDAALARVLLPDWAESRGISMSARLQITDLSESAFDHVNRTLTVGTGIQGTFFYNARVDATLRPVAKKPLVLWDKDEMTHGDLGLTAPDLESMAGGFLWFEGTPRD